MQEQHQGNRDGGGGHGGGGGQARRQEPQQRPPSFALISMAVCFSALGLLVLVLAVFKGSFAGGGLLIDTTLAEARQRANNGQSQVVQVISTHNTPESKAISTQGNWVNVER